MNSSWKDSNDNVLWHNSSNSSSLNNSYNQRSLNNSYNQGSLNKSYNKSSLNKSYNKSKNHIVFNTPNNQEPYNKSSNQLPYNKPKNHIVFNTPNNQESYNKLNNKMALNKSSNKMVIAMIVIVVILVSGIGVFYVRKNKKNDMDNSTQMVKNDSDMDNTWIVDDKLEDDISNGYMDNNEEDSFAINDENQMQENISEDTILTGSVSTTETEPPAVIKPTETTKPMETSSPVVITTAAPTLSPLPTASPVSTPMPTIAPAPTIVPVSTPTPTATPQPVVTQYASLVNPYTSKDSNGQIVYVLANSNNRYYSESELQSLTKEQLRFARNEIFARRGGIFTSSDLQQYFSSRSWYVPTRNAADFEDEDVNAYELANIKLIQAVEKTK